MIASMIAGQPTTASLLVQTRTPDSIGGFTVTTATVALTCIMRQLSGDEVWADKRDTVLVTHQMYLDGAPPSNMNEGQQVSWAGLTLEIARIDNWHNQGLYTMVWLKQIGRV